MRLNALLLLLAACGWSGDEDDDLGPRVDELELVDPALADCVAEDVTQTYAREVAALRCSDRGIEELTGIEAFSELSELDLAGNPLSDSSPLASLSRLELLDLSRTRVTSLAIGPAEHLVELDVWETSLTSLDGLQGARRLERLDVGHAALSSIEAASRLSALTHLAVPANDIRDLSPLEGLPALQYLDVGNNPVEILEPLSDLRSLTLLDLSSTEVVDVSPLAGLSSLTSLELTFNDITDLGPLTGLSSLEYLQAAYCQIDDIGGLASAPRLRELWLGANQVVDIGPLAGHTELVTVHLDDNAIVDVGPLASLASVQELTLSSNAIGGQGVGNVDELAALGSAMRLALQDNPTMSCDELSMLIDALGSPPVEADGGSPAAATPGINCTSP